MTVAGKKKNFFAHIELLHRLLLQNEREIKPVWRVAVVQLLFFKLIAIEYLFKAIERTVHSNEHSGNNEFTLIVQKSRTLGYICIVTKFKIRAK